MSRFKHLSAVGAIALMSTLALPALAQEKCGTFNTVKDVHAKQLNEFPVAQGISGDGMQMLVVFAAPDGATWSIVVVTTDGVACLKARGVDWQERHDVPAVPETGL